MFAMGPAKPHSERRRMLAQVYSKSYILGLPELDHIISVALYERFLPQIQTWARQGTAVNIHQENKAYNMDCNSAYFFGLGNGTDFIQDPSQKAMLKAFESGMSGLFWFAEAPQLAMLLGRIGIKVLPDTVLQSYKVMEDLALDMCKAAKAGIESISDRTETASGLPMHPTVYAHLCKKLQESNVSPEKIDETIAAELLDHLQAGHETSGITLTYLMIELSQNPLILQKLRQEFKTLKHPKAALSSSQVIENLSLLNSILMETMRVHPASLGPFPRYVPAKGAKLGDYSDIPAGTTVSTSVYSLHRNSEVFPEPER